MVVVWRPARSRVGNKAERYVGLVSVTLRDLVTIKAAARLLPVLQCATNTKNLLILSNPPHCTSDPYTKIFYSICTSDKKDIQT